MSRMESLYKISKKMLKTLNKDYISVDERMDIINKVNNLLGERGLIIEVLNPPYTPKEEVIGLQVVELDKLIRERMDELHKTIQMDLKQLKQQKDSNKRYINPYKDMKTVDGMYLDNKL